MFEPYTTAQVKFDLKREFGAEGKNSMAYIAHDPQLDAEIVIKKVRKADLKDEAAFYREARLLYASAQPDQGRYGIVFDGARGMPIASTFLLFLGACGSPPFAPSRTGGDELIDSEAGRKTLGYMRRLLEIAPPDALNLAWDQDLALFLSGRASMAYCWTMRASRMEYDIQSVVKRRVEYLPQPAGPGGGRASPIGSFLLAIPPTYRPSASSSPPRRSRG